MTTSYERPRQTIEQQFASGTTNTFTPTLYATIVGPVYEMVEDEDQGTYISEEKEYFFNSANSVDVRTSDDYEVVYPITASLEDAVTLYDDAQAGTLDGYVLTDNTVAPNDKPFDFALVTGESAYIRLNAGSYRHTFPTEQGTIALANPGAGTTYTLTSTIPIFYPEDYDAAVASTIDYMDGGGNPLLARTITAVSADFKTITFTDIIQGDPGAPVLAGDLESVTKIDRATLIASEKDPKRIRTILTESGVSLYTARDYAVYAITDYDVLRKMDVEMDLSDLIAAGVSVSYTSLLFPAFMTTPDGDVIESANVRLTYRALRADKFETLTSYETATQLAEDYTVSEYNTAVWMVYLALEQSAGRSVLLAPLSEDYFVNTLTSYQAVFDFIKEEETPFGIVPATMDPTIVSALKAHVVAASDEEWTNFRRGYVTHELVTSEDILEDRTTGSDYVEGKLEGLFGLGLRDADATFVESGVEAGHYIKVTNWTAVVPVELTACACSGTMDGDAVNWATGNSKLVITGVMADPGIPSGSVVRMVTATHTTTSDTGIYTDQTRAGVSITTGQTYGDLGYRVISAQYSGTTLTLYLYTTNATEALPSNAEAIAITVFDGPLSLREENAILNQNVLVSLVKTDMELTASIKPAWTGIYSGLTYDIVDVYSKDEQAENYAAYAEGLTERRVSVLYPDYFEDSAGVTWPAYFVCAARAGWRSGHPAHEPMTNTYLSNSFFYKLLRTDRDKYFRDSQLDKMAAGGVEIYLQTVAGAAIKCRHQLTTDRSSIQKQEETSTCAVDTACKMLKQVIKPLLGRYNIGPDLFSVLNTRIAGVRDLVTERPIANFGSILKSFEIATLAQDPNNADGLILEIDSVTQKPFNRIHTTMRIS